MEVLEGHVCEQAGLSVTDFSIPHRMSESIVRDVIVCTKDEKTS